MAERGRRFVTLLGVALLVLLMTAGGVASASTSHPAAAHGRSHGSVPARGHGKQGKGKGKTASSHPKTSTATTVPVCWPSRLQLDVVHIGWAPAIPPPDVPSSPTPDGTTVFVGFTNTTSAACRLPPVLNASLATPGGPVLAVPYIGSVLLPPWRPVLPPGGSDVGDFDWDGYCSSPPGPLTIRFIFYDAGPQVPPQAGGFDPIDVSPPPEGLGTSIVPKDCVHLNAATAATSTISFNYEPKSSVLPFAASRCAVAPIVSERPYFPC